jgi:type IV fimbrial biogenesis protein FimT
MTSRNSGFTVIELMVAVALLAVLLGIAAPSIRDVTMNARMTGQTNDLMTDLAIARSEAVKRGVRVALCTSSTGTACMNSFWNQGRLVFVDADNDGILASQDDVVKAMPAIEGDITITSTGHASNGAGGPLVTFRPSGVITPGGAGAIQFTLCDSRTVASVGAGAAQNKGRRVTVSGTGRAVSERFTCP